MGFVVLSISALALLLIGGFGYRNYRRFLDSSEVVKGRIVDVVERVQRSKDEGDYTTRWLAPIIEYELDVPMRFEGSVDMADYGWQVGDQVDVHVSRRYPGLARLKRGHGGMMLALVLCLAGGITLLGVAARELYLHGFHITLGDLSIIVGVLVAFVPLLGRLNMQVRNAHEVERSPSNAEGVQAP